MLVGSASVVRTMGTDKWHNEVTLLWLFILWKNKQVHKLN